MSFQSWLLSDLNHPQGPASEAVHTEHGGEKAHPWYSVMCLTGVDYFSTLGYQPGIAFLAAGFLSPLATLVLVLVTLFAALPMYNRVAAASPNGQGSIAMLQNLFPSWWGKLFVLALLGFATTDFIITMTLSAADAANHFTHNPYTPHALQSQMGVTLVLLSILGAVFLKGFQEAIRIAVVLVAAYLLLNAIVTVVAIGHVLHQPALIPHWKDALFQRHGNIWKMIGIAALLFPRLALGLSGFETGVAVMPLIESEDEAGRIANTRRLLLTAAVIMSVFLMLTSFVTTLLIPRAAFAEGGAANGRAMAYLAHQYMGSGFGAAYDVSTILILAFAGASAMAGLLNLIPRYLPGLGMAPDWARASRPLVLVFMATAFAVTFLFKADVDAQGGAYATGVLVLMTSASAAVWLNARGIPAKIGLGIVSLIFFYTTFVNIVERPEGLKISVFFILAILLFSFFSRALRSTELRIDSVQLDSVARQLLNEDEDQIIRLIAWNPEHSSYRVRNDADVELRRMHALSPEESIYFFEVQRDDASEFSGSLQVCGYRDGDHRVLSVCSPVVANAVAAVLMYIEQETGHLPHVYFHWSDASPINNVLRFLFFGDGDTAPLTHEVLRRAIPDAARRPIVHVS